MYRGSGSANLLPICYGSVTSAGTINTGTGNFTVTNTATGVYTIAITGITYTTIGAIISVRPVAGSGVLRLATTSSTGANELVVRTYDLAGNLVNNAFHFFGVQAIGTNAMCAAQKAVAIVAANELALHGVKHANIAGINTNYFYFL